MKKKIVVMTSILTLLAFALTGCKSAAAVRMTDAPVRETAEDDTDAENKTKENQAGNLNPARTIRIGDQGNYFTAKVALLKGFLEEEFGSEYTFELYTFANGPASTEAFVSGQIDLAQYGDVPAAQAFANGTDVRIISSLWVSDSAYNILGSKDSGIETIKDLEGRTIGFSAGTNPHKFLLQVLESAGLTENNVTLVNLSAADSQAAFLSGDVDAIMSDSTTAGKFIEENGAKVIVDNHDYDVAATLILAKNDFAQENPDTVSRILKVFNETNKWIADNQEEAEQIVADYAGVPIEDAKNYYEHREWSIGWSDELTQTIANTIQFSYEQGNISTLFEADELIDTSYLEAAGLYSK